MPLYFDCEIEILIFLGVNKLFFYLFIFLFVCSDASPTSAATNLAFCPFGWFLRANCQAGLKSYFWKMLSSLNVSMAVCLL